MYFKIIKNKNEKFLNTKLNDFSLIAVDVIMSPRSPTKESDAKQGRDICFFYLCLYKYLAIKFQKDPCNNFEQVYILTIFFLSNSAAQMSMYRSLIISPYETSYDLIIINKKSSKYNQLITSISLFETQKGLGKELI